MYHNWNEVNTLVNDFVFRVCFVLLLLFVICINYWICHLLLCFKSIFPFNLICFVVYELVMCDGRRRFCIRYFISENNEKILHSIFWKWKRISYFSVRLGLRLWFETTKCIAIINWIVCIMRVEVTIANVMWNTNVSTWANIIKPNQKSAFKSKLYKIIFRNSFLLCS